MSFLRTTAVGSITKNNLYKTTDNPPPEDSNPLSPQQKMAQDIAAKSFSSFGYNASPEELAAFSAIYHSENGGNALQLNSAVSNYITTQKRFQELNANDPTKQVLADEKGFFNDTQAKAAGYEKDANGVYQEAKTLAGQAPKLFGGLNPDQIDAYLAPTRRAADQSNALLQGQAAKRGLAGSSTELNSLADAERQYKENVLQAGLNLGINQQQTQLNILGNRQSQLFNAGQNAYGLLSGSLGRQASISGDIQARATDQANYLNQLPLFLSSANPAPAIAASTKSSNGLASVGAGAVGAIGAGLLTHGNPAAIGVGYQVGSTVGANV